MSSTRITGTIAPELPRSEQSANTDDKRKVIADHMVGRLSAPSLRASAAPSHAAGIYGPVPPKAHAPTSSLTRSFPAIPTADTVIAEAAAAPLLAAGMSPKLRNSIVQATSRVPEADRAQFVAMCVPWLDGNCTHDELAHRIEALASTWPPPHRAWLSVRR